MEATAAAAGVCARVCVFARAVSRTVPTLGTAGVLGAFSFCAGAATCWEGGREESQGLQGAGQVAPVLGCSECLRRSSGALRIPLPRWPEQARMPRMPGSGRRA